MKYSLPAQLALPALKPAFVTLPSLSSLVLNQDVFVKPLLKLNFQSQTICTFQQVAIFFFLSYFWWVVFFGFFFPVYRSPRVFEHTLADADELQIPTQAGTEKRETPPVVFLFFFFSPESSVLQNSIPCVQFFAVPRLGVFVRNSEQQNQWQKVTSERESLRLCKL